MKSRYFPFLLLLCGFAGLFSGCKSDKQKAEEALLEQIESMEFPEAEAYEEAEAEEQPTVDYTPWSLPFTDAHRDELYTAWVVSSPWMSSHMEKGGVNSILFYGLNEHIRKFTGVYEEGVYSGWRPLDGIEKMAGMPVRVNKEINVEFEFYNPEIINWGAEHLIPDPKDIFGDYLAQGLYENTFSQFFRLNTESYLWLQKQGYTVHQGQYLDAMKNVDFDGLDYLADRYRGTLSRYTDEETYFYGDWTPEIAIGFWLRRGIDGTSDELWAGLEKLMLKYDAEWWVSTVIEGNTPPEPTAYRPLVETYYNEEGMGYLKIKSLDGDESFYFELKLDDESQGCTGGLEGRAYPFPRTLNTWEYNNGECRVHFQFRAEDQIYIPVSEGVCGSLSTGCDFVSLYEPAKG